MRSVWTATTISLIAAGMMAPPRTEILPKSVAAAQDPAPSSISRKLRTTSNIDEAIEEIKAEIDYSLGAVSSAAAVKETLTALAAMNHTHRCLSPIRYGNLARHKTAKLPQTSEECLRSRAGICGNHVQLFLELNRRLGLRARSIEFYGTDAKGKTFSHIAAEVFTEGKWRYFDVTWNAVFAKNAFGTKTREEDLASFAEVLDLPHPHQQVLWSASNVHSFLNRRANNDPFAYLHGNRDVLVGKTGRITMLPTSMDNFIAYKPQNQPNYVGITTDFENGERGSLTLTLARTAARKQHRLLIKGSYHSANPAMLRITAGGNEATFPLSTASADTIEVTIDCTSPENEPGDLTLEVVPSERDQIAYIVFSRIILD